MSVLDKAKANGNIKETETVDIPKIENTEQEPQQERSSLFDLDIGFLMADTGEGNVEDYTDHVLNPTHSMGLARAIRGATGMFGSLNKAGIDVAFGLAQFFKEKRGVSGDTDSI